MSECHTTRKIAMDRSLCIYTILTPTRSTQGWDPKAIAFFGTIEVSNPDHDTKFCGVYNFLFQVEDQIEEAIPTRSVSTGIGYMPRCGTSWTCGETRAGPNMLCKTHSLCIEHVLQNEASPQSLQAFAKGVSIIVDTFCKDHTAQAVSEYNNRFLRFQCKQTWIPSALRILVTVSDYWSSKVALCNTG